MSELVEKCLELTRGAEVTKSKLSIDRFFRGLTGQASELQITGAELDQLVGVLFLITAVCEDELIQGQDAIELTGVAAEAFEHLSLLHEEPIISDTLSQSFYSAINYVAANKFSNATLLARRSIAMYEPRQLTLGSLSDLSSRIIYCLHLLVGGNLSRLYSASRVSNWTGELQSLLTKFPESHEEITCSILLIDALHNYAEFVLKTDNTKLEEAYNRLAEAQKLAPSNSLLCELLSHAKIAFKAMESCYVVPLLQRFGDTLPSDYVQLLTRSESPVYYLWPPQIKALSEGLLKLKRFAIRLPASAGKTLLAELKIVSALSDRDEALAFYVVPLNALARQVRKDLQKRLRLRPLRLNVKVLTGAYEIGDEELEIAGRKENVVITTPEKLDGLLRNIDQPEIAELFKRCRLFVFDECQTLSSERRGTTYEFLIARIMNLFPKAQILALSAVFENIEEFASWIGEGSLAYVKDDWRPTRQHWAVWPRQGGLVFDKHWVITGYERTGIVQNDLARICMDLQKSYENVLVLANSRGNAEKYAAHIAQKIGESNSKLLSGEEQRKLRGLADRVRRKVHSRCRLADMLELGVAYHHAHLPSQLKSEIEDYIADGTLKYVVSTTTLAQGLNFPIRCLVIPNIYYMGAQPISPVQLKNIVGRAGRAHVSTSGQIIIFKSSERIPYKGRFIPFENYCFEPSSELLKVGSSLEVLLNGNSSYEAFAIQESLDSQLLAFLTDKSLSGEDQSSKVAQSSFLGYTQPQSLSKLEEHVQQRLTKMSSGPEPLVTHGSPFILTEYGDAVRRTGFGPSGSEELRGRLTQILDEDPSFFGSLRDGSNLDANKIKCLLTLAFSPVDNLLETFAFRNRAKELFGVPPTKIRQDVSAFLAILRDEPATWDRIKRILEAGDVEFIWRWINGAEHEELSKKFFLKALRPTQEQIDRAIMDSIHAVESLHHTLSWTLYSVKTLLEYLLAKRQGEAISPEFDNFPYYMKYGVNHPVAVYLLDSIDWPDRKEALLIASDLPGEVSYFKDLNKVRDSLAQLGQEEIHRKLGNKERAEELWNCL